MREIAIFLLTVLLLVCGAGNLVVAASFDCDKASTEVEVTICSDQKLATLDIALGIAFRDIFATNRGEAAKQAMSEQRVWLSERDRCRSDTECLKAKYNSRLQQLSNANYDNRHEIFEGDLRLATLNPSLILLIEDVLQNKDLQSIDTIVYDGSAGPTISSAILFRDRSETAIYECGMHICNSSPAYLAIISGNLDDAFSSKSVNLISANRFAHESVETSISYAVDGIEIGAYWLRGGTSTTLKFNSERILRPVSTVTTGVISPGSGTMYTETYLFEQDIYLAEFGYVFGGMLGLLPRLIGAKDAMNPCKGSDFRTCDRRDIYDLAVQLYSEPETIHESLRLFDYLIDLKYEPAKKAYAIVSETIAEM